MEKIERWFGLLEQKMHFFNSIEEFVKWYNFIKPRTSLGFDILMKLSTRSFFQREFLGWE